MNDDAIIIQNIIQSKNQSIKIYIAPLQDPYSEVLNPSQAERNRICSICVV